MSIDADRLALAATRDGTGLTHIGALARHLRAIIQRGGLKKMRRMRANVRPRQGGGHCSAVMLELLHWGQDVGSGRQGSHRQEASELAVRGRE